MVAKTEVELANPSQRYPSSMLASDSDEYTDQGNTWFSGQPQKRYNAPGDSQSYRARNAASEIGIRLPGNEHPCRSATNLVCSQVNMPNCILNVHIVDISTKAVAHSFTPHWRI
jgi:hypothetical protein